MRYTQRWIISNLQCVQCKVYFELNTCNQIIIVFFYLNAVCIVQISTVLANSSLPLTHAHAMNISCWLLCGCTMHGPWEIHTISVLTATQSLMTLECMTNRYFKSSTNGYNMLPLEPTCTQLMLPPIWLLPLRKPWLLVCMGKWTQLNITPFMERIIR